MAPGASTDAIQFASNRRKKVEMNEPRKMFSPFDFELTTAVDAGMTMSR